MGMILTQASRSFWCRWCSWHSQCLAFVIVFWLWRFQFQGCILNFANVVGRNISLLISRFVSHFCRFWRWSISEKFVDLRCGVCEGFLGFPKCESNCNYQCQYFILVLMIFASDKDEWLGMFAPICRNCFNLLRTLPPLTPNCARDFCSSTNVDTSFPNMLTTGCSYNSFPEPDFISLIQELSVKLYFILFFDSNLRKICQSEVSLGKVSLNLSSPTCKATGTGTGDLEIATSSNLAP